MRLIVSAFLSCALLIAGQASAQTQVMNGDEYAASRKYCDSQWQSQAAASAAAGQSHEKYTKSCVCDRRWREKVIANDGTVQSREKDRRRCLGYFTGSDAPEYAFFGGSTLVLSLIGALSSDHASGGTTGGHPVSP